MTTALFPSKELKERNETLCEALVPAAGPTGTIEGEIVRAINRILYRYYNDGDYWFEGYGCETAGDAATFLTKHSPVNVRKQISRSDQRHGEKYEKPLLEALEMIVTYVEEKNGEYTESDLDYQDCHSKYKARYDDDDYYDSEIDF